MNLFISELICELFSFVGILPTIGSATSIPAHIREFLTGFRENYDASLSVAAEGFENLSENFSVMLLHSLCLDEITPCVMESVSPAICSNILSNALFKRISVSF